MTAQAPTPGQVAYEAHRDFLGGDRPWSDVREPERELWAATERAVAAQPQSAPELELASDEMRPGELDAVLATVPPCDVISPWGMRCRVIRTHETHRDRDGNMWQERPAPETPPPGPEERIEGWTWTLFTGASESAAELWRDGELRITVPLTADQAELLMGRSVTLAGELEHDGFTVGEDGSLFVANSEPEPEPEPKAAPELAAAMAESRQLLGWLDEATRTMLNIGTRPAEVNLARRLRKQAGLAP